MKILVLGSQGQLGRCLQDQLANSRYQITFASRKEIDITKFKETKSYISYFDPDVVINAAAYTFVDKAENEKEMAEIVNHLAVENIAKSCLENDSLLVHISTDYVFDGISKRSIKETDTKNPLNFYGKTKHLGEEEVLKNCKKFFIFRVCWIYGKYGNNFPTKIIKLINDNADITVVDDQIGAPISTSAIVTIIYKIMSERKLTDSYGIYNIAPNNFCSRHDMAEKIKKNFKNYSKEIYRIKSKDLTTDITRPQYSCLDNAYLKKTFKIELKNWDDYLVSFLEDLYGE